MSQAREDLLRIAADILQERGIKLDEAELQRLLGVPPTARERVAQHAAVHPHTPDAATEVPKWPPLDNGTMVRTRLNPSSTGWTEEALRSRRDGVVGYHDSHGLTYEVRHQGWWKLWLRIGCYEADELVVVTDQVPR
jgi:hypothetical protein